jgi:hypothetical protein
MDNQTWMDEFDGREQKCIDHARLYAAMYDHGDPGHMHMKVIAKLAALLDRELLGLKTEYTINRTLTDISQGQSVLPLYEDSKQ